MTEILPVITFKISRKHIPPATRDWLMKKRDYLSKTWVKKGPSMLRRIQRQCGLNFPARTISEGMTVYLHKRQNSDSLGGMEETKPLECEIYIRKSDTWRDIKPTLVT